MATRAEALASYENRRETATETTFDDAREDSRRGLIAVALGAALVIILLLVTASDIARMALEGGRETREAELDDRRHPPHAQPAPHGRAARALHREPDPHPGDPRAGGVRCGCSARSALDVVDVPFDSLGAQLDVHAGRVADPLLRRAEPLAAGAAESVGVLGDARRAGRGADGSAWWASPPTSRSTCRGTWRCSSGAVLAPTDPAILIPLFIRSRLKPKVAQTVIAESAFNDPTGAALALTLAGVVLTGSDSVTGPGRRVPRRPRDQHGDRDRGRRRARRGDLEPPHGHLARERGDRRAHRGHDQLLLARHGRRQRLPGRVPGGADRREHGAPGPGGGRPAARAGGARIRLQPRRHRDPDRVHGARREHPLRRAGQQPAAGASPCWPR